MVQYSGPIANLRVAVVQESVLDMEGIKAAIREKVEGKKYAVIFDGPVEYDALKSLQSLLANSVQSIVFKMGKDVAKVTFAYTAGTAMKVAKEDGGIEAVVLTARSTDAIGHPYGGIFLESYPNVFRVGYSSVTVGDVDTLIKKKAGHADLAELLTSSSLSSARDEVVNQRSAQKQTKK